MNTIGVIIEYICYGLAICWILRWVMQFFKDE